MIGTSRISLTKDQIEILKAVLYFDVFKYPLSRKELFENSAISINEEKFEKELHSLLRESLLKEDGDFILTSERTRQDIDKRLKGNEGAQAVMDKAHFYSKKIASFPFVESVCLSGSLSKNYYDENGDIDFFIITKPKRLWICRTLLIARYKLLPKEKKKYWCTNYFISSENLTIPDVNVFTGTELAYLLPTVNYGIYKNILAKNAWYKKRFPNKEEANANKCIETPRTFLKALSEGALKGSFGNWVDALLLNYTLKRWRKKYPNMSDQDFDLQFRSRKDVCKRHTHGFQNKVLVQWAQKKQEFEQRFNVRLD